MGVYLDFCKKWSRFLSEIFLILIFDESAQKWTLIVKRALGGKWKKCSLDLSKSPPQSQKASPTWSWKKMVEKKIKRGRRNLEKYQLRAMKVTSILKPIDLSLKKWCVIKSTTNIKKFTSIIKRSSILRKPSYHYHTSSFRLQIKDLLFHSLLQKTAQTPFNYIPP